MQLTDPSIHPLYKALAITIAHACLSIELIERLIKSGCIDDAIKECQSTRETNFSAMIAVAKTVGIDPREIMDQALEELTSACGPKN